MTHTSKYAWAARRAILCTRVSSRLPAPPGAWGTKLYGNLELMTPPHGPQRRVGCRARTPGDVGSGMPRRLKNGLY